MKMYLKRALSLILAVVMAMSLLPLNVLAATVMDTEEGAGRAETPIQDGSDAVARTSGRTLVGGDERPEVPGGGDESGDLNWDDVTLEFTIDAKGNYTVVATSERGKGQSLGAWALLVAPDISQNTSEATASKLYEATTLNSDLATKGQMESLVERINLPKSSYDIRSDSTGSFGADGKYTISGTVLGFQDLKDALTGGYYLPDGSRVDGTAVDGVTNIKFVAYLVTKGSSNPGITEAEATMRGEGGKLVAPTEVTVHYNDSGIVSVEPVGGTATEDGTNLQITLENTNATDATLITVDKQGGPLEALSVELSDVEIGDIVGSDSGQADIPISVLWEEGASSGYYSGTTTLTFTYYYVGSEQEPVNVLVHFIFDGGWSDGEINMTVPEGSIPEWSDEVVLTWNGASGLTLDPTSFQITDPTVSNESAEPLYDVMVEEEAWDAAVGDPLSVNSGDKVTIKFAMNPNLTAEDGRPTVYRSTVDVYVSDDNTPATYYYQIPVTITVLPKGAPEPDKGTVRVNVKGNSEGGTNLPITGTVTLVQEGSSGSVPSVELHESDNGTMTDVAHGTYKLYLDGKDTGCTVEVNGDTATGTIVLYGLTVTNGTGGTADFEVADPLNKAYGASGNYFIQGAEVNITAKASSDYEFDRWVAGAHAPTYKLGSSETDANATVVMDGQTEVEATFKSTGWTAKVTTKHGEGPTNPGGKVELRKSGEASRIELTESDPSTKPGVFDKCEEELDPGTEYEVWVNGFKTKKTVTKDLPDVEIGLRKVTVEIAPTEAAAPETGNTAYLQFGDEVTGTQTMLYIPNAADIESGPHIAFKATVGSGGLRG